MGKAFIARARHPLTGRRIELRGSTRAELEVYMQHFRDLRTRLRLGLMSREAVARVLARLDKGAPTLQQAAEKYRDSRIATQTRRRVVTTMAHALAPLLAFELEALDVARVSAWVAGLRAKHAPNSVLTHWRLLRTIVGGAISRGELSSWPWGDWRPRFETGPLHQRESARDVDELARLLAGTRELDEGARTPALAFLTPMATAGALLGLRQGELAGLKWSDVDADAGTVTIARQWNGAPLKTRSSAAVLRASPALFEELARWREKLEGAGLYAPDGPVFPHPRNPLVPTHWRRGVPLQSNRLQEAARRAGLPSPERWTAHSLRDTFATLEALASGGDVVRVQRRTRHATMHSLQRYVRSLARTVPEPGFDLPPRPQLAAGGEK